MFCKPRFIAAIVVALVAYAGLITLIVWMAPETSVTHKGPCREVRYKPPFTFEWRTERIECDRQTNPEGN